MKGALNPKLKENSDAIFFLLAWREKKPKAHSIFSHGSLHLRGLSIVFKISEFRIWLVGCFGLNASISVYIRPSPKEREKEKRKGRRE